MRSVIGERRARPNAPVTVQVITYAPTAFYHCQHCELTFQEMGLGERLRRDAASSSLPEDLSREYQQLSDWIRDLVARHGAKLHVKVIDAASIEGVLASLRHRVFRYPAVIVDGREKRVGTDLRSAEPIIDRHVARASAG
ncbi:MAG: hypothetical protein M3301_06220 [Chloroflexota bacterium]|nr:hypothetical protein [Chloroflexota bacterium]